MHRTAFTAFLDEQETVSGRQLKHRLQLHDAQRRILSGYRKRCCRILRFALFPLLLLSPYGRHYRRFIRTASPIHLMSQPTSLPTHYIGLQVWNPLLSPLPLSPRLSTGVITYNTTYHPMPNVFYLLLLLLYTTGFLEDEAGALDEHGEG